MISVYLVGLKVPENVGFVARVMKNFGFEKLYLFDCEVTVKSFKTASHAVDVLRSAKILRKFDEITNYVNMLVGTTGVVTRRCERYIRKPTFSPEELREFLEGKSCEVAIAFGREDYGLFNDELELCHMIVSIPTNPDYPVMNVSHAVAVLLYELSKGKYRVDGEIVKARDVERLIENFEKLMIQTWYPRHRIERTKIALRRILGRSLITKRELSVLHGVVTKALTYIEHLKKQIESK
ncbi:MAG: RNA methyltransferase [Archaeoglobales archaeon]|nr:MAG: RNA methyltransferase [Archaeoglobales archaeon]